VKGRALDLVRFSLGLGRIVPRMFKTAVVVSVYFTAYS
jgi:hypothetical protein